MEDDWLDRIRAVRDHGPSTTLPAKEQTELRTTFGALQNLIVEYPKHPDSDPDPHAQLGDLLEFFGGSGAPKADQAAAVFRAVIAQASRNRKKRWRTLLFPTTPFNWRLEELGEITRDSRRRLPDAQPQTRKAVHELAGLLVLAVEHKRKAEFHPADSIQDVLIVGNIGADREEQTSLESWDFEPVGAAAADLWRTIFLTYRLHRKDSDNGTGPDDHAKDDLVLFYLARILSNVSCLPDNLSNPDSIPQLLRYRVELCQQVVRLSRSVFSEPGISQLRVTAAANDEFVLFMNDLAKSPLGLSVIKDFRAEWHSPHPQRCKVNSGLNLCIWHRIARLASGLAELRFAHRHVSSDFAETSSRITGILEDEALTGGYEVAAAVMEARRRGVLRGLREFFIQAGAEEIIKSREYREVLEEMEVLSRDDSDELFGSLDS